MKSLVNSQLKTPVINKKKLNIDHCHKVNKETQSNYAETQHFPHNSHAKSFVSSDWWMSMCFVRENGLRNFLLHTWQVVHCGQACCTLKCLMRPWQLTALWELKRSWQMMQWNGFSDDVVIDRGVELDEADFAVVSSLEDDCYIWSKNGH